MHRLLPEQYQDLVRRALAEDIGEGDVTSLATVPPGQRARGIFLVKSSCVLAGSEIAIETFRQIEPGAEVIFARQDGDMISAGESIGYVAGLARTLLAGERTALNFLQRLCGIATVTRRFVDAAAGRVVILDTRKTTPTLRAIEKYAVAVGGGTNHRFGLYDAVLIKDNHVRLARGVASAVALTRQQRPDLRIEVEVQTLDELDDALAARADIVLLDNMPVEQIREAVRRTRGRARLEISGGVTLETLPALAATGADFVSVGALTHSAPAADISFEIQPE